VGQTGRRENAVHQRPGEELAERQPIPQPSHGFRRAGNEGQRLGVPLGHSFHNRRSHLLGLLTDFRLIA